MGVDYCQKMRHPCYFQFFVASIGYCSHKRNHFVAVIAPIAVVVVDDVELVAAAPSKLEPAIERCFAVMLASSRCLPIGFS